MSKDSITTDNDRGEGVGVSSLLTRAYKLESEARLLQSEARAKAIADAIAKERARCAAEVEKLAALLNFEDEVTCQILLCVRGIEDEP
jgi:hypothetical protein